MSLPRSHKPFLLNTHTRFALLTVDTILSLLKNDMLPLPSVEDYSCTLYRCRMEKNLSHALQLHTLLHQCGLESHTLLGNSLVALLADIGLMQTAYQLFHKLLIQNDRTWHSLIIGYVRIADPHHALLLFRQMQIYDSICLSGPASVALLKACTSLKDPVFGNDVHTEIARAGLLDRDLFVGSTLIDMYAKFGLLTKAQQVFEKLSIRNVVTWNTLMAAYANHGYGLKVLDFFDQMHVEDVSPDPVTFVCCLKACASIQDTDKGQEVHDEIERQGLLEKDHMVGVALVDMYIKGGSHSRAQEVFNKLLFRDVVAWTALIASYAEQGCAVEVSQCLAQMQLEGAISDAAALVCKLQACGCIKAINKGRHIHAEIVSLGLVDYNLDVGNALIDMYAKCGLLPLAQTVFDKIFGRDVISWNSLISGYIQYGHAEEALELFDQMQLERVTSNIITYVCILKACGCLKALDRGQELHNEIKLRGLDGELPVGNALIDMYAKCGLLVKAQEVFDKLSARTEVSWTSLISGYVEHGYGNQALRCFECMVQEGVYPDVATFVCSLKACGMMGGRVQGEEMHTEIKKKQGLEGDVAVSTTLIDMYVKCGSLSKAREFFDNLPVRNACLWTTLIAGHAEQGRGEEALNCFEQMLLEGISPDDVAYICCLKACGNVGATGIGIELHSEVARKGFIEQDPVVGSILVDMYTKCGSITFAQQVFDRLPVQGVAAWNSLISGHSQLGDCDSVFLSFYKMLQKGMVPDSITFLLVLSACKHAGLSQRSMTYMDIMSKEFGLIPTPDHQACMVDTLCRTGHLDEALAMIRRMPCYFDLAIWHAMLGVCKTLGNIELGKEAFENTVHAAAYIMLTHINTGAVT